MERERIRDQYINKQNNVKTLFNLAVIVLGFQIYKNIDYIQSLEWKQGGEHVFDYCQNFSYYFTNTSEYYTQKYSAYINNNTYTNINNCTNINNNNNTNNTNNINDINDTCTDEIIYNQGCDNTITMKKLFNYAFSNIIMFNVFVFLCNHNNTDSTNNININIKKQLIIILLYSIVNLSIINNPLIL